MLSMSRHISEYDMGEEGDLFKALEEAVLPTLSFFNNELCDKAFDEWEQDRMVESATTSPRCGFSDIKT